MHVSRNIHSGCIFPEGFSGLQYGNFNENSSMRAVAKNHLFFHTGRLRPEVQPLTFRGEGGVDACLPSAIFFLPEIRALPLDPPQLN